MISIRSETPNDRDAVRRVIVDAFTECDFGHHGEADIVDRLRNDCDDLLSLVATEADAVVGHILFSPASIRTAEGVVQGMGLAPLAVAPHRQNVGLGTMLVEAGLERLSANGCPFVLVLGHPHYYSRFGFQLAAQHGVSHGFTGIPQNVFFVNILDPNATQSIANGTASYRPEFGAQDHGTASADAAKP